MSESLDERRRRKFGAGVLDQLASGLGSAAAGLFTAGFLGPIVAGVLGATQASLMVVGLVALAGLIGSALLLWLSTRVKGIAKRRDDDQSVLPQAAVDRETRYIEAGKEADDGV